MADFAHWTIACEGALGLEPGQFLKAYTDNRSSANEMALDVSPLPVLLRELVEANMWEGTASELQAVLDERASDGVKRLKAYPKNAKAVGSALRRLAPNLRETGLEVTFYRETTGAKRRLIRMSLQTVDTDDTVDTEARKAAEARKEAGDVSSVKGDNNRQTTVTTDVTRETSFNTQLLSAGVNGDDGDIKKQSYSKANTRPIKPSDMLPAWDEV